VKDTASIGSFDVVAVFFVLGVFFVVVFFLIGVGHGSDEKSEGSDGGFYFHMVFGLVV
jgi:hypothetical protein